MIRRPPRPPLFPYTTLFQYRSARPSWSVTHAITGQSDKSIRADRARATFGVTGADVKVGIISDSFAGRTTGIRYQDDVRSEEHTSELQSRQYLVCRLLLEKK